MSCRLADEILVLMGLTMKRIISNDPRVQGKEYNLSPPLVYLLYSTWQQPKHMRGTNGSPTEERREEKSSNLRFQITFLPRDAPTYLYLQRGE